MRIDQYITFATDIVTKNKLKELSKSTGISQSRIFRTMIAMAAERFEKEQSGAFLLASD